MDLMKPAVICSSREHLIRQRVRAITAVDDLMISMRYTAPREVDYATPDEYRAALTQYEDRIKKIDDLRAELFQEAKVFRDAD